MVLPKKTFGRRCSSRSGTCPVVTNCSSVPVITSGMGGHPETLMMGLSPTIAVTGQAPVESSTLDVSLKVPAAVGVPVIAPVDELSVRPDGRLPAEDERSEERRV